MPAQASRTQGVSLNWGVQRFGWGGCHEHQAAHRDEALQRAVGELRTGRATPSLQGHEPDGFSVFLQIAVCKDMFAQIFFNFHLFTCVFCLFVFFLKQL